MQSNIIVREVIVDQKTGHITVQVQTETVDGTATHLGPIKQYGCCAETFHYRFGRDEQQLLNWIANEHAAMTGVHVDLVERLTSLKGRAIAVQSLE